jgi:O-antigen/teichoic acid export membrane protein
MPSPIPESVATNPVTDRRIGIADLRRHTANGMLVNSGFQIGLVAISALRGLIVAAFLTRSDYGLWGLLGLTLWTALGFKSIFGANDKYIQQSEDDQEAAFQRAFTIELIFAAAITPIAAGAVVAFALLTGRSVLLLPGFVLLLMLPSTALQFPVATFYRRMNYRRQRVLQAIEPLGGAAVMVTLAVLGAGYWSFIAGALFGSWAAAVIAIRASPYPLKLLYDSGTLKDYVRFSAPLLVSGISVLALFQVIMVVGAGPLGLAGLGAFTLVGNLVQFTDQADSIVTDTLYPAICAIADRVDRLSEVFVKSNRLSLIWAVPFGVGLTLFGSDLIHFGLGRRWLPAVPLLQIMGVVTAVHHVGYNWSAFVRARGTTWPIAVAGTVTSVVVIAFGVPLMYSNGLVGIGCAFGVGEGVALIVRGTMLRRFFTGVHILSHLARAFAPTLLAVVLVVAARDVAGPDRTPIAAIGMFSLYALGTIGATWLLERPLISEAIGYLLPQGPRTV